MDINLLKAISEAPGVSGFEYGVLEIIKKELKGHVDEISEDKFGNLYVKKGKGTKTMMIAAHTDEIGLLVKHIDDKGFIRFAKLGGVPDHILLAQRVWIHGMKKRIRGVIGCKAIHVMKDDERKQLVTYDKMFIDTGATKDQLENLGVKVGTPITIDRNLTELENDVIVGRAMDDRAGCYLLVEALKRAMPINTMVGVFTVQEEVGLRGATISAFAVKPDIGIAIDTTIAGDHPEITESDAPTKLGKGPSILVADGRRDSLAGGTIANPIVRGWMMEVAEKTRIPYQLEVLEGGTTDAAAMQLSQEGTPSGCISIPSRYVHSCSEVVSKKDLDNGIKFLVKMMESKLPF
jgi:putative aminopeptidase FrvX